MNPIATAAFYIILMLLGARWCREVSRRFRDDWREFFHEKDRDRKPAILLYWLVTAVIIAAMSLLFWQFFLLLAQFWRGGWRSFL